MACHPDLVLRSKTNSAQFAVDDAGEAIVCRLCNDVAEDAIHAKCRHLFDRECIKRYIEASPEDEVRHSTEQVHRGLTWSILANVSCLPRSLDD